MNDDHRASGLWLDPQPLVLASASASRALILAEAGIPFDVRPSHIDERAIEDKAKASRLAPARLAALLARAKALDVAVTQPGRLALGADQILSLDGSVVHKAGDRTEAAATLRRLSGRAHALDSALCLARDGRALFETVATARLTMRALSDAFIADYLDVCGDAVLGSVGCYHIEAVGVQLFSAIEGDPWTIRGLPLPPLLGYLRDEGYLRV